MKATVGPVQRRTVMHAGPIGNPPYRWRWLHVGPHVVGWQSGRSGGIWLVMPLHNWRQRQKEAGTHQRNAIDWETL